LQKKTGILTVFQIAFYKLTVKIGLSRHRLAKYIALRLSLNAGMPGQANRAWFHQSP
jgi:hypothetical protein